MFISGIIGVGVFIIYLLIMFVQWLRVEIAQKEEHNE